MADTLTVVVVDDHSIFRSGLRADLDRSIEVVGEAADVPSAVAVIAATRPDVVLLDARVVRTVVAGHPVYEAEPVRAGGGPSPRR